MFKFYWFALYYNNAKGIRTDKIAFNKPPMEIFAKKQSWLTFWGGRWALLKEPSDSHPSGKHPQKNLIF